MKSDAGPGRSWECGSGWLVGPRHVCGGRLVKWGAKGLLVPKGVGEAPVEQVVYCRVE